MRSPAAVAKTVAAAVRMSSLSLALQALELSHLVPSLPGHTDASMHWIASA